MGLVSGSASFIRFGIEGDLPENALDYIAERVAGFSFTDIDDSFDEYSIGWVSVVNMFDSGFSYASYRVGDYITLSVRVDERKVSPAVLKKFVQKEEERVKKEKQIPKLSRAAKNEIKERIRTELTVKSIPVPTVYDLFWNLTESTVVFFTTNKKAHAMIEDFFKDCFGLFLVQQIPYLAAGHLLDQEQAAHLDRLVPEVFV